MELTEVETKNIINSRISFKYPSWKRFKQLIKYSPIYILSFLLLLASICVFNIGLWNIAYTDISYVILTPDNHTIISSSYDITYDGIKYFGKPEINLGVYILMFFASVIIFVISLFLLIRIWRKKIFLQKLDFDNTLLPLNILQKDAYTFYQQTGNLPSLPTDPEALKRYDKSIR